MKSRSPEPIPPPASGWLARLGHEMLCAGITGIFCCVEFLVLLTELRPTRLLFRRSSPPAPALRKPLRAGPNPPGPAH